MGTPFTPADLGFGFLIAALLFAMAALVLGRAPDARVVLLALAFKFVACLAFYAIYTFYYEGEGDALDRYHPEGIELADALRDGTYDGPLLEPFYFDGSTTDRTVNSSGLVHLVLCNSVMASGFFFALLGFLGQLNLYRTFVRCYPDPRIRRWWQLGLLFFPSLTYWSSGVMKDTLGLFALGCAVRSFESLMERTTARALIGTAVSFYLLLAFRSLVVPVLLVAFAPRLLDKLQGAPAAGTPAAPRRSASIVFQLALIVGTLIFVPLISKVEPDYELSDLPGTLHNRRDTYRVEKRDIVLEYDSSWAGMLKVIPQAIIIAIYRPFVWETRSPVRMIFALENLVLLLLTLKIFRDIWRDPSLAGRLLYAPLFLPCLLFVICFSAAIGLATPNLGTMSRYRLPMLPFLAALFTIAHAQTLRSRPVPSEAPPLPPRRPAVVLARRGVL
jgi:hypothetical protein